MKLFPESAAVQLEFDKIKTLLELHCRTEYARIKARELRIHTKIGFIETELRQTHEFRQLLLHAVYFPGDFPLNLAKDLQLLLELQRKPQRFELKSTSTPPSPCRSKGGLKE